MKHQASIGKIVIPFNINIAKLTQVCNISTVYSAVAYCIFEDLMSLLRFPLMKYSL